MRANPTNKPRVRTVAIALALAAAVASVIVFGLSSANAAKSIVLGATKDTPKPACPETPSQGCNVMGTVTGFGVSSNGKKGLYRIPGNGRIVAWSLDMSKPTKKEQALIGPQVEDKKYGMTPVARLAILKHKKNKKGKSKSRYTLTKQSPILKIQPNFGHKPIYTLKKPLRVKKGQVAALTTPTYAPIYSGASGGGTNTWKASRPSSKCADNQAAEAKPQMRKGTTRNYGCTLTSRILYYAYFVKTKDEAGNGGGGGGGKPDPNRVVTIGPSGGPDAGSVDAPTGGIAP